MAWCIRLTPSDNRVSTDFIGYEDIKIITFGQAECRTHPYTILGIPVVTQIIDERTIFGIKDDERERIILRIKGAYDQWTKKRCQKQKHRHTHPSSLHLRVE